MDLCFYGLFVCPATTQNVNLTKIFIIAHLRGSMLMLWWMLRWFLRIHDRSRVYTVQMCTPGSTYTGSLSTNQRRAEWVTDQWESSIPSALETPASALHQHNSPSVVSWPRGGEVSHHNPHTNTLQSRALKFVDWQICNDMQFSQNDARLYF